MKLINSKKTRKYNSFREESLSIIIVAYNNGHELVDCLDSVFKYNDLGSKLEVIVVDNSPSDKVFLLLKDYDGIIYTKNHNNGFGFGNN